MTISMQWALRRRMMMSAHAGVDVANLLIQGSCTFMDYGVVTMGDGNNYRLLAITKSGNLVLTEPVNIEVCVVGGGAGGTRGGPGGAGAYMKNQVIEAFESGAVVVGAAQGASSIGGINVNTVSGKNGGTGGGGYAWNTTGSLAAGTGDGLSKYPFADMGYSLWTNKPHCGGGAGGTYGEYRDGDFYYRDGGAGGTNGSNGMNNNKATSTGNVVYGGSYGGGNGGGYHAINSSSAASNATYYGSGGGGGGRFWSEDTIGDGKDNGASGYQGIIYVRIPLDQSILAA